MKTVTQHCADLQCGSAPSAAAAARKPKGSCSLWNYRPATPAKTQQLVQWKYKWVTGGGSVDRLAAPTCSDSVASEQKTRKPDKSGRRSGFSHRNIPFRMELFVGLCASLRVRSSYAPPRVSTQMVSGCHTKWVTWHEPDEPSFSARVWLRNQQQEKEENNTKPKHHVGDGLDRKRWLVRTGSDSRPLVTGPSQGWFFFLAAASVTRLMIPEGHMILSSFPIRPAALRGRLCAGGK